MSSKERNECKNKSDLFCRYIESKLIMERYSKKQIAVLIGISLASFYNRLNNPDTFTYHEMQNLFHYLKFTPDERLQVI